MENVGFKQVISNFSRPSFTYLTLNVPAGLWSIYYSDVIDSAWSVGCQNTIYTPPTTSEYVQHGKNIFISAELYLTQDRGKQMPGI